MASNASLALMWLAGMTVKLAGGVQLRAHRNSTHATAEPYRQELWNVADVQYTGDIDIGGQTMRAILDTGSFELLVLSKDCKVCGDPHKLYDSGESADYKEGKAVAQHNFGSGTTFSNEAFDTVQVGPLVTKRQHFWQVFDAMMPILQESAFAAIVGVGPPDSAGKVVDDQGGEMMAMQKAFRERGLDMPGRLSDLEAQSIGAQPGPGFGGGMLTGKPQGKGNPKSLCSNFDVNTFSVCIGQESGSKGFFVWNDESPDKQEAEFTDVAVEGSIHWAARLTDVQIGFQSPTDDGAVSLGCKDGCAAVVDSGTSLIAAPNEVILQVDAALAKLNKDCSNLGEMPDLVFSLGGSQFSLPPDAYIGQVVHNGKPGLEDLLHLRFRSHHYSCMPLFMSIDVDSQLGPMWILGLPFFRKYYTTFSFDPTTKPIQKQLSMALADDQCMPTDGNALLGSSRSQMRPKKVEVSELRLPRWAEEAVKTKTVTV